MMKPGIIYKQRDILLVPIPFTDLSSQKKRPVVVISNDDYNGSSDDIIVAAITSNIIHEISFTLLIDSENLEEGAMPKKSIVRCDKIYTIAKNIIVTKFNVLDKKSFNKIKIKINNLLQ